MSIGTWVPDWRKWWRVPSTAFVESDNPRISIYQASKGTRLSSNPRRHTELFQNETMKHSLLLSGHFVDKIKQLGVIMEDEDGNTPVDPRYSPILQWESVLDTFDIVNVYSQDLFDTSPVTILARARDLPLTINSLAQDKDPSGMRRLLGPDATAYTSTLVG